MNLLSYGVKHNCHLFVVRAAALVTRYLRCVSLLIVCTCLHCIIKCSCTCGFYYWHQGEEVWVEYRHFFPPKDSDQVSKSSCSRTPRLGFFSFGVHLSTFARLLIAWFRLRRSKHEQQRQEEKWKFYWMNQTHLTMLDVQHLHRPAAALNAPNVDAMQTNQTNFFSHRRIYVRRLRPIGSAAGVTLSHRNYIYILSICWFEFISKMFMHNAFFISC